MLKRNEIEEMLYGYKETICEIKNLEIQIKHLENDYTGINPISYEENTSSSRSISSVVENEIIHKDEKIRFLRSQWSSKSIKQVQLQNAIEVLTDIEKVVIEEYYFNRLPWWKIAPKVAGSEKWCRKIRDGALKTLIKCIK